jgi:hypothetical protein
MTEAGDDKGGVVGLSRGRSGSEERVEPRRQRLAGEGRVGGKWQRRWEWWW